MSKGIIGHETMSEKDAFIEAYHKFRDSIDLNGSGFVPDLEEVAWCMLMGVPRVPADDDPAEEAQEIAIDQRVAILKAVFVEVNRERPKEFLDRGMKIYDEAGRKTKTMLKDTFGDFSLLKRREAPKI
jgi:hypothetical protein